MFKFLQQLFFSQINATVKLGQARSLLAADMPLLPDELDPKSAELKAEFSDELISYANAQSLLWSLAKVSWRYWLPGFVFMLISAALNLTTPYLVKEFIAALENHKTTESKTWILAVSIGLIGIFSGVCIQHFFYQVLRVYQILTNVLNEKLFSHALALPKTTKDKIPVGDIVNHMSSDSDSIANAGTVAIDGIYNLIVMIGVAIFLANLLGWSSLVAWILLAALLPLTRSIALRFSKMDEVLMKHRDQRVTLMSQILNAIRVVKFFAWEKSVTEEVAVLRNKELATRRQLAIGELLATLCYVSVGTLVLFAVLSVHVFRGYELSASLIFACLSLFNLLEDPFASLSRILSALVNAKVGAARICNFMQESEIGKNSKLLLQADQKHELQLVNWSVQFKDQSNPSLNKLNLQISENELVAIVGPVGSGKSTLLLSLIGEYDECASENAQRLQAKNLKFAYVPQEAYLINGSLRENIIFGGNCSEEQIHRALEDSCFIEDLAQWNSGIETEIGEKGVNLSGGQKQRLSLARACLQNPDVVFLDDPLSAVDPKTEQKLIERLVLKSWSDKTRLVVTHRLDYLHHFDRILFMSNGEILAQGTHQELLSACAEYQDYIRENEKTMGLDMNFSSHEAESDHSSKSSQTMLTSTAAQRVTQAEDREQGSVRQSVYWDYIRSLGGRNNKYRPLLLLLLAVSAATPTLFPLLQKWWLGQMSDQTQNHQEQWRWIMIYGGLGIITLSATLMSDFYWLNRGLQSGKEFHDRMLKSVLGSPIRFFDATPVGRVLQRFSRDLEAIDIQLQWTFEQSMKCFAQILITLAMIMISLPIVVIFFVPCLLIYWRYQGIYRKAAREAKRLDSISRSPRYAHFKETLQGLTTIRAFNKQSWFLQGFFDRLQENQRMFYGHYMINRWFSVRIPFIGGAIAVVTTLAITQSVSSGLLTPGLAGLLTIYSLSFWGVLNWGVRIWADVEARMTSVERVQFLCELEQEKSVQIIPENPVNLEQWPQNSDIEFRDVSVRYAPEFPLVLKKLSFKIKAKTRVGLIGRTGSGKSTIFQCLYRFMEIESGQILIDGVDLRMIPLEKLRQNLAVIPQDPALFLGTLRSNLDRFGVYEDQEIWKVLERAHLADWVRSQPSKLETPVLENGHNLSQGQRQLLCLARALLLKAKILIMDEATASVDVKTDAIVQKLIREECQDMTVIMIAHRLGTVRDCDQIIELSHGELRRELFPSKTFEIGPL